MKDGVLKSERLDLKKIQIFKNSFFLTYLFLYQYSSYEQDFLVRHVAT